MIFTSDSPRNRDFHLWLSTSTLSRDDSMTDEMQIITRNTVWIVTDAFVIWIQIDVELDTVEARNTVWLCD